LIWLADRYRAAALAPLLTDDRRPAFQRWMAYVSSAIYGRVQGDPLRLLTNERQAPVVLDRIAKRCTDCWRWMDEQIAPRRFLLGDELGIAVRVSCWSPRRKRFYSEAPKRCVRPET